MTNYNFLTYNERKKNEKYSIFERIKVCMGGGCILSYPRTDLKKMIYRGSQPTQLYQIKLHIVQ